MNIIREIRKRIHPILFLLALLSAFPPLATDMYLPALPLLEQEWGASAGDIKLSLIIFFITYCVALLIYGPLSERYGRRRPLLFGISLFIIACLICAFAQNAGMMIFGRFLQGAGAAGSSGLSMAICKDLFTGRIRQKILVQIGMIVATAPMVAPIFGGWITTFWSWRWIFLLQAAMAVIAATGVARMREPMKPQETVPGFVDVAAGYFRLLFNGRYLALLLTFSFVGMPVFAFIGESSHIYISQFGYTETQFGYFFGFNSIAFILAPMTFARLSRRFSAIRMLPFAFGGIVLASLLLLCSWIPAPWRLTLPMFFLTFCFSFSRPPGNNLILEQINRDTGQAAALMVFCYFMTGALAIWLLSFAWPDKIAALGWMSLVTVTFTLISWLPVSKKLKLDA